MSVAGWFKTKRRRYYARKHQPIVIPTPLTRSVSSLDDLPPVEGVICVYGHQTVRRLERIRNAYARGRRRGWRWHWEPAA